MTDISRALGRLDQVMRDLDKMLDNGQRLAAVQRVADRRDEFRVQLAGMANAAAAACKVPLSAVTIVDDQYMVTLGVCGGSFDMDTFPADQSYCQYVAGTGCSFSVDDALSNPLVRYLAPTVGDPLVRSYYGAPIFDEGGLPLGSFCIADYEPRRWKNAEMVLIDAYASHASAILAELR